MDGQRRVTAAPIVVPISEFRRTAARLVEEVNSSHAPVFLAQRGYVTAVLLSREVFDDLRTRRSETRTAMITRSVAAMQPPLCDDQSRRVWTQYGACDYETASLLANDGVETELVLTEDGWALDDEG